MTRSILLSSNEQLVRNFATKNTTTIYPLGTAAGSGTAVTAVSSDWIGSPQSVCQLTKGLPISGGSSYTYARIAIFAPLSFGARTINVSVWVKPSVSGAVRIPRRQAGVGVSNYTNTTFGTTANVWQRLSVVYPIETGTTSVTFEVGWESGDQSTAATMLIANAMVTAGSTLYDFADGNMPGWKWDGTANASSSVGYPYTLPRMVGNTAVSYVTTNPSTNISATPTPLIDKAALRTALFMYEITGTYTSASTLAIARHGGLVVGQTRIRLLTTTTAGTLQINAIGGYWNAGAGTGTDGLTNTVILPTGSGAIGKHILAITWNGIIGTGSGITWNLDGTQGNMTFDSGTGFDDGGGIYGYYNGGVSLSGAAYAFMNSSTVARNAAIQWLANRYGIVLAS